MIQPLTSHSGNSTAISLKELLLFLSFILFLFNFTSCQTEPKEGKNQQHISIGIKSNIYSEILDENREIWIHVPEGFYGMNEAGVQYPVLYVLDGESLFIPTVGILSQLSSAFTANDLTPQMIVVGIPNTNRNRDLTPTSAVLGTDSTSLDNTGGGPAFLDFIEKELIPYIDNTYSTVPHRCLVGHSLGGLFAMHVLNESPALFANYIAIDPAMDWDNNNYLNYTIDKFSNSQTNHKKLYLASANELLPGMELEHIRQDTSLLFRIMNSILLLTDQLAEIDPPGIKIKTKFYEDANHFQIPLPAIYDGLKYLYAEHHFNKIGAYYVSGSEQSKKDLVLEIKNHFQTISQKYNYEVKPMESYINAWAWGFLQFGKSELADDLLHLNIEYYPNSARVYASKGYYLLTQQDSVAALASFQKSFTLNQVPDISEQIDLLK